MAEPLILKVGAHVPVLGEGVFLASGSVIAGNVEIGRDSSVWFNAVIRADEAPVKIGERTNIQDGTVLHADPGFPCVIGDNVTVGHRAIVHGANIGSGVTVGMGAILLNGAVVGDDALIAAGAVVTEGAIVAPGTLVTGIPAREKRPLSAEDRQRGRASANRYVENARRYRASTREVIEAY